MDWNFSSFIPISPSILDDFLKLLNAAYNAFHVEKSSEMAKKPKEIKVTIFYIEQNAN